MKRLFFLTMGLSLGLLVSARPSSAQSVDLSVGYSYFRLGGSGGLNQNGVSGSVSFNPNHYFGIVGDFGGYHASPAGVSVNTYTYLVGPRIMAHNPTQITPFIQFLVGGAKVTVGSGGGSSNNFAYSVGGGVDLGVLPHLALRPQLDYVGIHNYSSGGQANCTRVSVSAVVRF